jgi:restriction system protein
VDLLNSRRYQLIHCNWRDLHGTAFEYFVEEIFEELGFAVKKTKVTGDQGVDLIVSGKGRKIAVQTKGYTGSVGIKAIQEVYTGMAIYQCRECVAVTNSCFTPAAVAAAHSVGCTLVDGQLIPSLPFDQLY